MPRALILPHELERIAEVDAIEHVHARRTVVERHVAARVLAGVAPVMPIASACDRRYRAVHSSGKRPLSQIALMVLHDEEALTALTAAAWFANTASAGSAHLCNDDRSCFRCLDDADIPWGAPGANYRGLHFEQAGFASWPRTTWTLQHHMTIDRTAFKVAFHIHKYRANKIPVAFVDHVGLQAGRKGITTHAECTKAFGGTHTDPGRGYPIDVFMARCEHFYAALTVRRRPRSS